MEEEDKIKLIADLEDIKDKDSAVIDELEMLLSELKNDHKGLVNRYVDGFKIKSKK